MFNLEKAFLFLALTLEGGQGEIEAKRTQDLDVVSE